MPLLPFYPFILLPRHSPPPRHARPLPSLASLAPPAVLAPPPRRRPFPPKSGTHLHNGLKGAKGAVTGAPVVAVAVHTLLQDVLFAGETHLLVGHPPAGRAWLGSARAGSALRLGPPCAWGGDYSHAAEHVDGLRAGSVLR